jgi:hypothetical protein
VKATAVSVCVIWSGPAFAVGGWFAGMVEVVVVELVVVVVDGREVEVVDREVEVVDREVEVVDREVEVVDREVEVVELLLVVVVLGGRELEVVELLVVVDGRTPVIVVVLVELVEVEVEDGTVVVGQPGMATITGSLSSDSLPAASVATSVHSDVLSGARSVTVVAVCAAGTYATGRPSW